MFSVFIAAIIISIAISFFCSLAEAAIYAVSMASVKHTAESGSRSSRILLELKENIGRPIAAILVLNTISNTAGAAIAGASAGKLWGDQGLLIFSILFTISILIFSEIIPKIIGVEYNKRVSIVLAIPIWALTIAFKPLVVLSQKISKTFEAEDTLPKISEEEVLSMAAMGTEEGTLHHFEGSVISNVMALNDTLVREILTPRVSVFKLSEDVKISEVADQISEWGFTRVPLHDEGDSDHLTGYIIQRDILRALLKGDVKRTLKEISRPLLILPELTSVDKVLFQMFEQQHHICALIDEYGGLAGIVTLEDILEEIVGREIEDEYDSN